MKTLTPEQKAKIYRFMAARKRELSHPGKREYPRYELGMTAAEYIRRFNALNCDRYTPRITLDFQIETCCTESRTYDPLTPLCEELPL